MATTTIFRPNALSTDIAYDAGQGYRRATVGGVSRDVIAEDVVEILSNETTTPWSGDVRDTFVAAARDIDGAISYRARAMFRFVLRDQSIDASSIYSGTVPSVSWWPNVTGARLVWFNGDQGGLQGVSPLTVTQSALHIRVGRGLYTPTGANERPFGREAEVSATFNAASTFGSAEATLAWADWATPTRSTKTLVLSQAAIDDYLKTITGPTDDFLDFAFYLDQEGVDGVDINREIGAWEPYPPLLEIDFDISTTTIEERACVVFRADGAGGAMRYNGRETAFRRTDDALAIRSDGSVTVFRLGDGAGGVAFRGGLTN